MSQAWTRKEEPLHVYHAVAMLEIRQTERFLFLRQACGSVRVVIGHTILDVTLKRVVISPAVSKIVHLHGLRMV